MPSTTHTLVNRAWRSAAFRLQRYADWTGSRSIDHHLTTLGLGHAKKIPTWTRQNELEALYRLAAGCSRGAHIVELGSYLGASTCYLAAGASLVDGRVTAIDLWNNETITAAPRDTFAEFQRNIAPITSRVTVLRKRTDDLVPADVQPQVSLAFIDADHAYDAARRDAAFMAPFVAPDGIMAFHDATVFEGVNRALSELLLTGEWRIAGQANSLTWICRAGWSPWPPPAANSEPTP